MKNLGRVMKVNLPTVSCVAESSEPTYNIQCVIV